MLPVKAEEVLGQKIDVFHKDPAYQRKILSNDKNLPHRAIIQIGDEKADLLVSPTYDESGTYLGPMVTWEVVTEKLKTEQAAAEKTSMVENAPVNIMLADTDLKIRYLNPASIQTLKTLEQHLPCKVDDMIGLNIDIFHKDPSYQRGILANYRSLPRQAIIELAGEKLDLLVSATFDTDGEYAGPMVTWSVVTEKLRNEAQAAEKTAIVENAPINIILADTGGTITYMNPASSKTLRTIETALPIAVDKIDGSSYDVFHSNPPHQRRILSDPKNLPHEAEIEVAGEVLALTASAIYDADGDYAGPMIAWELITQKKLAEQREQGRLDREKRGQEELRDKVD